MPRKLVDIKQISEMLDVKPATIYEWVRLGKIPFYKMGKLLRFSPEEVWRWASKHKSKWQVHPLDLEPYYRRSRRGAIAT